MKMKKTLTAVVAMALVAAVSVAGTMAYLTKDAGPVTNTFTAGTLGAKFGLELWENPVEKDKQGNYTKKDETHTKRNAYEELLPGSVNFKNPTVEVNGLETEAYLFIEVINNTDEKDAIEASVMKDWVVVDGATPKTPNAIVYKYQDSGKVNGTKAKPFSQNFQVLTDNQFTVKDFTNIDDYKMDQIVVNAYICQSAGFDDAADAWATAF